MNKAIRLDSLKKDAQARAAMCDDAIAEYADDMREGQRFPPIVVFEDGDNYWLADGFHRVAAAERAGLEEIEAETRYGGRRNAILHACAANATFGVRRTNADKRQAVRLLLEDEEWRDWSNREIARHCGVDDGLVRKVWDEVSADNPQMKRNERMGKRGGKVSKWRMPSRSKSSGSKPRKGAPATPAERDAFAALQAAWERASGEERMRFLAWARDDDPSAFEDSSAPVSDDVQQQAA